jgi:alpha/beta superfamily hydrolase
MEDKITFLSDGHEIEGRLEKSSLQKGVVITHPHPLYGGDMHNNVVKALSAGISPKRIHLLEI